jgi:hypothetical protein
VVQHLRQGPPETGLLPAMCALSSQVLVSRAQRAPRTPSTSGCPHSRLPAIRLARCISKASLHSALCCRSDCFASAVRPHSRPGFGRFAGVDVNPTTELVSSLQRDAAAVEAADRTWHAFESMFPTTAVRAWGS